jgi:hypothetical protein
MMGETCSMRKRKNAYTILVNIPDGERETTAETWSHFGG